METDDKSWLVELSNPIFPLGLRITRMASTDELPELLELIREHLPEWRAQSFDLNRTLRQLDRATRKTE